MLRAARRLSRAAQVLGDAAPGEAAGAQAAEEAEAGGEYEYVADGDADGGAGEGAGGEGGLQTLAPATEEQLAAARGAGGEGEGDGEGAGGEAAEDEPMPDAAEAPPEAEEAAEAGAGAEAEAEAGTAARARRARGAAAARQPGPATADDGAPLPPAAAEAAAEADAAAEAAVAAAAALEAALRPSEPAGNAALVAARLERSSLHDEEPRRALSEAETAALRAEAEEALGEWRARGGVAGDGGAGAAALWSRFEALTAPLSGELCEQLRLILEPTLAARLRGDYKTGKRLNMRKIIPYLASEYRRDKIWLRRSKPSTRRYQVRPAPCAGPAPSPRPHLAGYVH